ncbi:hypothetical protein EniyanLRS_11 [Mycobacterium phage EniyanLRS]|uniref:Uncharacterized protein n=1 Tax=Mycobacterium phage EniyanLRS TaxID=1933770 RepID=A0A2I2MPB8_9CAUD|nr:hypothetical protein EniyanLRS_11 [Mycobacterium phage EniyanLRS]
MLLDQLKGEIPDREHRELHDHLRKAHRAISLATSKHDESERAKRWSVDI